MTKRARGTARPPTTLWIPSASLDRQLLDYTAIEDRLWDARLLAWDIFGSLGHVESLRASKLLSPAEYRRIRTGLRAALAEVDAGTLRVGPEHEDVHTSVEDWLTRRIGPAGERLHTGRSIGGAARTGIPDQVAPTSWYHLSRHM